MAADMPEPRPRKERAENAGRRRRQLLDAARRSILKHGLARTTLATVSAEAGLSQGVAVFYFKSKGGLLTETLRDLYQGYEDHWTAALEAAGSDPQARLSAIIAADFDTAACGSEVLPMWFAFWGELHFQAQYDEVAREFDDRRRAALVEIWQAVRVDLAAEEVVQIADMVETLTDGYWQHLHLTPDRIDRTEAHAATERALARLVGVA
ncbi:TetR/AcrR family transcriptional repressor of bet genes [Roseovarius sp. MBR-154]|jgi:TetR/AcrR family transcriptional repressor of bet genes